MDTWATSSVSPAICATLLEPLGITAAEFARRYRPMSLRPNAHDIIRTWDFYTIVRSLYATGEIPWTDVLISGHGLDPAGKKISKSKLKAADDPTAMVESYSADAVRYWATSVRTGSDTVLSDEVMKGGNRLVTKLWNAAKLALPHLEGYRAGAAPAELNATDRWLLARLYWTVTRATAAMEEYEFAAAKGEAERFFWSDLCDNYLEMVKFRLYDDAGEAGAAARESARYTLANALLTTLKLLAPFMPHITDEIYQAGFAASDGAPSIHVARWPQAPAAWADAEAERIGAAMLEVVDTVRRWKAERKLSVGAPVAALAITCPAALTAPLSDAALDLRSVTRARRITVAAGTDDGVHVRVEHEPSA
jgi:valyl-tRNA synthetase